jgi:hypothetical protein
MYALVKRVEAKVLGLGLGSSGWQLETMKHTACVARPLPPLQHTRFLLDQPRCQATLHHCLPAVSLTVPTCCSLRAQVPDSAGSVVA